LAVLSEEDLDLLAGVAVPEFDGLIVIFSLKSFAIFEMKSNGFDRWLKT